MKKKFTKLGVLLVSSILFLTGCGEIGSNYDSSYAVETYSNDGGMLYTSKSTDAYMDYSNTSIYGDMADYQYTFNAKGKVTSKQNVLDVYEQLEDFTVEKGGYIENLNNNYYGYALDKNYSYSENEINNIASGTVSFNVQIPKEDIEEAIKILDDYVNNNNWIVTQYRQVITNYQGVKIVDEYDEYSYYEYTQEEIDRILKYATINVRLDYSIPRSTTGVFGAKLHNIWYDTKEVIEGILGAIIGVFITIIVFTYTVALPVYKIIRKSIYKHKLKHPEMYDKNINVILKDKNNQKS